MMTSKRIRWGVLLLPLLGVALAAVLVLGAAGSGSHTASAVSTLTVGLDMSANAGDAGTYGATLPKFDNCTSVKTSVNNGVFYYDVFALNTTNLYAFNTDLSFTAGKMQILGSDVKQFFGTGASVDNLSRSNPDQTTGIINPPISDGSYNAQAVDTGAQHTGSGVLARIKAQAFIGPSIITLSINNNPGLSKGVTFTADPGAYHPGDTNGDSLFDGPFINQTTTIAVDQPDTDGDGVNNTCDNCPNVANGLAQANVPGVGNQTDTDGDGIGDACDPDIDGDGVLNASDNCPFVYNPTQDPNACLDSDGDGILNGVDNCPNVANGLAQANVPGVGNQTDTDGDGIGDACDPDIDGDGVLNAVDNCKFVVNPTQADWNNDGIGDACQDSDADGILDSVDNCKAFANPGQTDADHDGVGDACDNCPNAANATQADFNNNLVGDACDDSDADGWTDAVELFVGTNPNQKCASTVATNDEPVDSSPTDNNDDRKTNLPDVLAYAPAFNSTGPGLPYKKRLDITMDNKITLPDILKFAPVFNTTCVP